MGRICWHTLVFFSVIGISTFFALSATSSPHAADLLRLEDVNIIPPTKSNEFTHPIFKIRQSWSNETYDITTTSNGGSLSSTEVSQSFTTQYTLAEVVEETVQSAILFSSSTTTVRISAITSIYL